MERLKAIKENLIGTIQSQMCHLNDVDAKELGEVMDMVKDIEEAIYYCTITEAMNKKDEQKTNNYYYTERYLPPYVEMDDDYYYRDMDKTHGKMYYTPSRRGGVRYTDGGHNPVYYGEGDHSSSNGTTSYYGDWNDLPMNMRDSREGVSHMTRRSYMEGKELHKGKEAQIKELEKYMKELSQDVTEMIKDASPEEKTMLQQKLNTLATKIV